MITPPTNLDIATISAALLDRWNLGAAALTYAPLGYGSHHWIAEMQDGEKWFVTVDDLSSAYLGESEEESFEVLAEAFQTAAALRDTAQLAFVNAPIADCAGRWLLRLDEQYAMAVFPFIDVEPTEFDVFPHEADLYDAIRLVGEIHAATPQIPASSLRKESFVVPKRAELLQALDETDIPWSAGPYSESARLLLADHAHALQRRLDQFDRLAAEILADRSGWVVSQGEPHAGNVIRTRSGNMVVVDWSSVAIAPPERDLWMLMDGADPGWPAHQATHNTSLSEHALTAYRLYWNLSDIAVYVSMCRSPHEQTEEMAMIWAELKSYVKDVTHILCRTG